jgi:hypothetical protein
MSHLTEEFLRKRSSEIIQDKAKNITIFNKDAEESFPRFHPSGKKYNTTVQYRTDDNKYTECM